MPVNKVRVYIAYTDDYIQNSSVVTKNMPPKMMIKMIENEEVLNFSKWTKNYSQKDVTEGNYFMTSQRNYFDTFTRAYTRTRVRTRGNTIY